MPAPLPDRTLDSAQRDARAARLRGLGYTYAQIAEQMGLRSQSSAHDAVRRALRETVRESAADLVAVEQERLDTLWSRVMPIVLDQNVDPEVRLKAVDRAVRISERRSRLLGLDAPTKTEVRVTDSLDAQLEELALEVAALAPDEVLPPPTELGAS